MGKKRKNPVLTKNERHNDDHKSPTSEFHNGVVTYCCDATGAMKKKEVRVIKKRLKGIRPCPKRLKCRGRQLAEKRSKMGSCTFDENMETIWRSFSERKRAAFAHLDSFYFISYKTRRARSLELIRKKDIFSKKDHWRLVIFCHFGEAVSSKTRTRCILLLDSAEMCADVIIHDVRKFVFDIFKAEGRPESKDVIYQIPLRVPKVPQQKNDVDCGRFVLYFIKRFMDAAPRNFSLSKGYPYFLTSDWFKPEEFDKFCEELDKEIPTLEQGVQQVPRRYSQRTGYARVSAQQTFRQHSPKPSPQDEVILIDDSETSSGSNVT